MVADRARVGALVLALASVACSLNDLDETLGKPSDASVASGGVDGGGQGGLVGDGGFPSAGSGGGGTGSGGGSGGSGGSGGGNGGSGGSGGGAGCGAGEKLCGGACVAKGVANGCDAASCAPCSIQNGKPDCAGGQCAVGACNAGFADCDKSAQNGCETPLGTSVHCSSCTDACSAPTGTAACVAGACKITACPSLRADCDGLAGNGCEADLTTPATCTNCTNKCAPAFDCAKPPTGPHLCACSGDASCLNGGTCYLGICVCGGTPCPGNQRCTLIGTCF